MLEQLVTGIGNFLAGGTAMTLYWFAAIGGTLFFLFTLCFSTFEIGGVNGPGDVAPDGTFDAVDHVDTGFLDFQLISFKSILAFVTMFGWTGVVWGKSGWLGFLAAFVIGLFAMFLTALAIYLMLKLQHSGNVKTDDIVGAGGTVYITIPAGRGEHGKVTVNLKGSTQEIAAVADEEIPTGTPVKVAEALSDTLFLVRKV